MSAMGTTYRWSFVALATLVTVVSIDTSRAQSQGSGSASAGAGAGSATGSDETDDEGGTSGSARALVAPKGAQERGGGRWDTSSLIQPLQKP